MRAAFEPELPANSPLRQACYVWPPVGSFCSHFSHNLNALRPGLWSEPCCVSGSLGFREDGDPIRELLRFAKKGKGETVVVLEIVKKSFDLHCCTERQPDSNCTSDLQWTNSMRKHGFLDEKFEYAGPAGTEREKEEAAEFKQRRRKTLRRNHRPRPEALACVGSLTQPSDQTRCLAVPSCQCWAGRSHAPA